MTFATSMFERRMQNNDLKKNKIKNNKLEKAKKKENKLKKAFSNEPSKCEKLNKKLWKRKQKPKTKKVFLSF